jgi:hypothetical protein
VVLLNNHTCYTGLIKLTKLTLLQGVIISSWEYFWMHSVLWIWIRIQILKDSQWFVWYKTGDTTPSPELELKFSYQELEVLDANSGPCEDPELKIFYSGPDPELISASGSRTRDLGSKSKSGSKTIWCDYQKSWKYVIFVKKKSKFVNYRTTSVTFWQIFIFKFCLVWFGY